MNYVKTPVERSLSHSLEFIFQLGDVVNFLEDPPVAMLHHFVLHFDGLTTLFVSFGERLDCGAFLLAIRSELVYVPRFALTFSVECNDRLLFASAIGGELRDSCAAECDTCLQLVNVALVVDACVCGCGGHRAVGEEEAREAHFVDAAATLRTLADRVEDANALV